MKKTLYVSDLDGTLLNSDSVISQASVDIINHLIEKRNVMFSIATARTPATVVPLMEDIRSNLPYVVMTGATLWDNGFVNQQYMRKEEVDCLSDICKRHGLRPFFYTYYDGKIRSYHSPKMDTYESNFVALRAHSPIKEFVFDEVIPEKNKEHAMLMFVTGDYEEMGVAYEEAKSSVPCSMTYYRDIYDHSVGFLEVMAEGVSKAVAVERLKKQVGADRLVVFGDSPNDLSMKAVADLFVAPENASDEVLKVADAIIGTNNSDSVARWMEKDVDICAQEK